MDASPVPARRAERDISTASTCGTDQGNCEDPPAVLSGREAHDLSDCRHSPVSAGLDPGSETPPGRVNSRSRNAARGNVRVE